MAKTKIKPILPSLREKKRYLVFEVISKNRMDDVNIVSKAILSGITSFVGQLGAAKAGVVILSNKWDPKTQRGIIKISHKHVDAVKASFALAGKIGGDDAVIRSLGVSGILAKAEKNFMKG